MTVFRHPFDCRAIRAFHRQFGRAVIEIRQLPFRDAAARLNEVLLKYQARVGNDPLLRLHMQRMVQELLFLEAIGRDFSVKTVIRAFKRLVALGFRELRTEASLELVLSRYLVRRGQNELARRILEEVVQEVRSHQVVCKENIATARVVLSQINKK